MNSVQYTIIQAADILVGIGEHNTAGLTIMSRVCAECKLPGIWGKAGNTIPAREE